MNFFILKKRGGMTRIRRRGKQGAAALRKRRYLQQASVIISIAVSIALFYVWSRIAVVQTGYRLHDLARQHEQLEEEYRVLKLELATRKSPGRLGPLAQNKLGLRHPDPKQVIILPEPLRLAEQGN